MSKLTIPSLLALSLVFLPVVFGQTPSPATGPSQLVIVGTNIVDLGTIPNYKTIHNDFHIRNQGATPIEVLRLIPTCSCIKGFVNTNTIPPNGEAVLTLQINPASVHGVFKRGLWLETNDPGQSRITFAFAGEVVPLFTGAPSSPIALSANGLGASWTNRFTLTATESGAFLGQPNLHSNENLRVAFTLTTNATEKASYELTVIITSLSFGRNLTSISVPVIGRKDIAPLKFEFQAQAGSELYVAPPHVLVTASDKPLARRLLVKTDAGKSEASLLTWVPQREGVAITVKHALGSQSLMVSLDISTNAAAQLLKEKNPTLTFNYPNHKPAVVTFSSSANSPSAAAGGSLQHRRGISYR